MTAKEETAKRLHLRRKLLFTKTDPLLLPLEEKLSVAPPASQLLSGHLKYAEK